MKLLIDQQLPPMLAEWLRGQGMDARHVREIGLKDRTDPEIWNQSIRDGAVIISRDSDFALFARQDLRGRLIWLRIGNCRNPQLIEIFESLWPRIVERLNSNERIIEVHP